MTGMIRKLILLSAAVATLQTRLKTITMMRMIQKLIMPATRMGHLVVSVLFYSLSPLVCTTTLLTILVAIKPSLQGIMDYCMWMLQAIQDLWRRAYTALKGFFVGNNDHNDEQS